MLDASDAAGGMTCTIEYSIDLYAAATMRASQGISELVAGIPPGRIAASGLYRFSATERQTILGQWSGENRVFGPAITRFGRHELFERHSNTPRHGHLLRAPRLTYAELNTRADQLARELTSRQGHPRHSRRRMSRAKFGSTALLAMWKSGGAYLPLDPAYPRPPRCHAG